MKRSNFRRTFRKLAMSIAAFCLAASILPGGPPAADAKKEFPLETPLWVEYDHEKNPERDNHWFPDGGASYWGTFVTIPEGATLQLVGQYAHGRYMSVNSYDGSTGAPTDAVNDTEIMPDEGSSNPFFPGAKRAHHAKRDYTITILDETPIENPANNTLYAQIPYDPDTELGGVAGQEISLVYRVYIADKNRDKTGGVGLPEPRLVYEDGTVLEGQAAYDVLKIDRRIVPYFDVPAAKYAGLRGGYVWGLSPLDNETLLPPGYVPEMPEFFPAFPEADWGKVFNVAAHSAVHWYYGLLLPTPDYQVGQYATLDNQYATVHLNRGYGEIAVLRAKAPVTPQTYRRAPFMDADVDMRYWSITTNESLHTTKVVDSTYDEDVPVDENGYFTIIVCLEEDLPSNASERNGVKWLNWGENGDGFGNLDDGFLIMRHMLPSPDFDQALQNVTGVGTEAMSSVLEEYYPTVTYMSTEEFEALGDNPGEYL